MLCDDTLHTACVYGFVALRARGLDSGTATCIESLFLQGSQVGVESHFSAERVQLKDKMTFSKSTD